MALYLLYGSGYNQLTRMASAAVPEDASTKYPIANLTDGIPNKPFIFGSSAGSKIDFDLQQVPNGTMETAFVGGLPTAAWVKIGTTTVTRDTGVFNEGAASAKLDFASAAGSSDAIYYDVIVQPGESLTISADARSVAPTATRAQVRVRNLDSGNYLTGTTWQAASVNYAESTSSSWDSQSNVVTVESYAACGYKDRVTLRITAGFGSTPNNDIYFDNIKVIPTINFASVHGHNIPASAPVQILSGSTSPAGTVRGTFTHAQPTMFCSFSNVNARYWQWKVTANLLDITYWLGEMVLGQTVTATRRQNYGQELMLIDPQDRTASDIGPLQAFVRTAAGRRQVSMQFRLNDTATDYAQWKEILERSRNGAIPLVVVVESGDASTAIMGRVDQRWPHTRVTNNIRDHSLVLDELPNPVVIA